MLYEFRELMNSCYNEIMNKLKIPKLLQEIPDAPKRLYIAGEFPYQEDTIFLTVIGSRKFTPYGKSVVEKVIGELRGYPFVIVSGLALGIDAIAHRTALKNNLTTIAVPGSGLDESVLYPASHRNLAREIIQSGGCLISELEPKTKAAPWTFPQRNRIMAGLAHAVIVVEAENKSGTRITARLATEYNRDVFAVPGSVFSKSSEGCNELIREGAIPLTSVKDILEHFGFTREQQKQEQIPLSNEEEKILEFLRSEAKSKSALARELDMPIFKLNTIISSLEIKGLVGESLGKVRIKN